MATPQALRLFSFMGTSPGKAGQDIYYNGHSDFGGGSNVHRFCHRKMTIIDSLLHNNWFGGAHGEMCD
jgi:hypothetical protein